MNEYQVVINGIPHTVQATAEDAKARGLEPKSAKVPANKARKPRNKATAGDSASDS